MAEKKKMRTKTKVLIALYVIGAVIVITYLGFAFYFRERFIYKTTINGLDVSTMTLEEVKNKIEAEINHYQLTINGRKGMIETIPGEAVGIGPDWEISMEQMLENQNAFLWLGKLWNPDILKSTMLVKYDEDKLNSAIAGLYCTQEENQLAPEDARISEYTEAGYQLVPSEEGTTIIPEKLKSAIVDAVVTLTREIDIDELGCYTNPQILDDNAKLLERLNKMNYYAATVITYEIGEEKRVLDGSTIHDWIIVKEDGDVIISEEAVDAYVAELAKKYTTVYQKKKLKTSYGIEIEIPNSFYGWKVNKSEEKKAILEEIAGSQKVTRELHYSMTANSHGANDYGDSYVEINLTAQHLFLYKDGKLVTESDFVSGNVSKGNGTPAGVWGLTYKARDATLKGEDYESFVNYWMPFNGNIGMHDASWRKVFGASYYKRDGSHGCINMPFKQAEIVFNTISKNYPVFVYELEGTQSEAGIAQDQAYEVIDAIKAIGSVKLTSEPAIANARAKYDALSEKAKKYVTNYKKLTNAEAVFAELKAAEPEG